MRPEARPRNPLNRSRAFENSRKADRAEGKVKHWQGIDLSEFNIQGRQAARYLSIPEGDLTEEWKIWASKHKRTVDAAGNKNLRRAS